VKQLERLLDDGLLALRAAGGPGPDAALARADRLNAAGKAEEAAAAYREALARGGPSWRRRPRAVESLVMALLLADRSEECAAAALREGSALPAGSSRASALSSGLSCALDAEGGPAWRAPAIRRLEPLVRQASRTPGLLADDRAGLLEVLARAREEAGDARGARAAAQRLWRLLEAEARRTPSAELRASLDSYRVSAALTLARPALAVPALSASEKALPDDYNPPYRLAILYREMGRQGDAVAAADRALSKAYGPRKLRIYDVKASALEREGNRAALEATLAEAVAYAGSLPEVQVRGAVRRLVERMRERLEKARG
jgi:tetratricopeptide (TPR) repeat protein